jgi:hypothetical protein
MFRSFLITMAVLLYAGMAMAAIQKIEGSEEKHGCKVYVLCDAETANQTCGGSGTERYIRPEGMYTFTAMADKSTSTDGWTVLLYNVSSGVGYHASRRTQINSTALSTSNYSISWSGKMGDIFGITADISTGNVTVEIHACPVGR